MKCQHTYTHIGAIQLAECTVTEINYRTGRNLDSDEIIYTERAKQLMIRECELGVVSPHKQIKST